MKHLLPFLLLITACETAQEPAPVSAVTDTPTTEDFTIGKIVHLESEVLGEERILNIYLPLGYHPDSARMYPVIYLLDGSAHEDFIHISGLVQFGSFSWIGMIPETIVVGVANVDRKRDFTSPSSVSFENEQLPMSGGSEKFIRFVEQEVQPYVETHFKTSGERTLIGQSLGGLVATEMLFRKPDMFDRYIIVSPSLWWDNQSLLNSEPDSLSFEKPVYIAVSAEGEVMEKAARDLYRKLKDSGDNQAVYFHYLEEQNHGDALHLAVYGAFEAMFDTSDEP